MDSSRGLAIVKGLLGGDYTRGYHISGCLNSVLLRPSFRFRHNAYKW